MKNFTDEELEELSRAGARVKARKKKPIEAPKAASPQPKMPSEVTLNVPPNLWKALIALLKTQEGKKPDPMIISPPPREPVTMDVTFHRDRSGGLQGATVEVRPKVKH